jgi:hypothetical protein
MDEHTKRVEELTVSDLRAFPIWEYTNTDEPLGETAVQPVKEMPAKNLDGRLVGTRIRLANGSSVWALICNVDSDDPRATRHFLTLAVFDKEKCFDLARYHDIDSNEHGPQALAAFLRLPIDEVFPISYDLSRFSLGDSAALVGTIPKEPREKLSEDQLISMAVQRSRNPDSPH